MVFIQLPRLRRSPWSFQVSFSHQDDVDLGDESERWRSLSSLKFYSDNRDETRRITTDLIRNHYRVIGTMTGGTTWDDRGRSKYIQKYTSLFFQFFYLSEAVGHFVLRLPPKRCNRTQARIDTTNTCRGTSQNSGGGVTCNGQAPHSWGVATILVPRETGISFVVDQQST